MATVARHATLIAAYLPAQGSELAGASYRYLDETAPPTALRYWLEDIASTGAVTRHGPVTVAAQPGRIIRRSSIPREPSSHTRPEVAQ